jgi:LemA protein
MKKSTVILLAVLAVVVIFVLSMVGSYNSLVSTRENVNGQQANVQTMLQRRSDLIPNLVETVKSYASHETEVFTAIADARAKLAGSTTMAQTSEANTEMTSALNRLLVVVENYPNLKADTQYTALMDELAGAENRIAVARKDYNDAARSYNQRIQTFPNVILAGMFGFEKADYFEAAEGAETVPTVNFGG